MERFLDGYDKKFGVDAKYFFIESMFFMGGFLLI
jgi:hypothetical protein